MIRWVDYCVAPSDAANAAPYPHPQLGTCDAGCACLSNANLVPGAGEERCLLCNKCLDCENTYEAMVGSCDQRKRKVTYRWPASVAYRCSLNATLPLQVQIDQTTFPWTLGWAAKAIIVTALCMVYTLVNIALVMAKSNEQVGEEPALLHGDVPDRCADLQRCLLSLPGACREHRVRRQAPAHLGGSCDDAERARGQDAPDKEDHHHGREARGKGRHHDMLPTALAMVGVVSESGLPVAIDAPVRTATLKVVDPHNVYKEYECSTTSVFETLLIFYCGGILLYACVMAYQIRKCQDDLQETKALLFFWYTIFLFTVFGIPLLFMIKDNMVRVLLLSIFINIPTVVTVFCLCMPKASSVMG